MPGRNHQHDYDKVLYKDRNSIERFFNKLKNFRRIATRYDKLLANFLGFVTLGAIHILIRYVLFPDYGQGHFSARMWYALFA